MTITVHSFTFEATTGSLFLRIPGIGELFVSGGMGWVWSPWSEVVEAEAGRA
jgi:hypothetical protein